MWTAACTLLVALAASCGAEETSGGKSRYLCSQLKPLQNMTSSEFLGSWLKLEIVPFHFGSPQFPSALELPAHACQRVQLDNATDSLIRGRQFFYESNATLTSFTEWSATLIESQSGKWTYVSQDPYELEMQMVLLEADPERYLVFATCTTASHLDQLAEEGNFPARHAEETVQVPSGDLLIAGLNILRKQGDHVTLTHEQLTKIRENLKNMIGLQDYNPWCLETYC